VTVEEYRRFLEDEGYQTPRWWKNGGFGERSQPDEWEEQLLYPNRPVVNVTWYEAAAWCAWAGGRLPTEAEWERASRGPEGRKYPWGNEKPDPERANYDKTNINHATPVGLFPRGMTPDGIDDLAGNVYEWVADWYADNYSEQSSSVNPTGPASGQHRVLRGGSWFNGSWCLRSSYRVRYEPDLGYDGIGFRCVREVFP
jgi:formylglycine-generating enzyme required for sulfatase activity